MGVDADRQATFRDRKRNIVQAFNAHMSLTPGSAVSRFGAALREDRTMIAGSDIDGIVSAMMLASVSTWRIGALAMKSETILVSPHRGTPAELLADTTRPPFGIDVFSRLMPTASNHPVLFGTTSRTSPGWRRDLLADFDERIATGAQAQGALNPSLWTGIKATLGSQSHDGIGSVTVTLDRYGHLYDGLDGQIADGLDELLRDSRGLLAASGASRPGSDDPS